MAIVDDLKTAVTKAISAGAEAARGQGKALSADYQNLLLPNLEAVVVQIAAITEDVIFGDITKDQALPQFTAQFDCIPPLILAEAELVLLGVQIITNAIMDALKSAVNAATTGAIGISLL
jgi:hypothetical protein